MKAITGNCGIAAVPSVYLSIQEGGWQLGILKMLRDIMNIIMTGLLVLMSVALTVTNNKSAAIQLFIFLDSGTLPDIPYRNGSNR